MCKFCDKNKENSLVSYDNKKNMDISFGQYQGVNVYGTVDLPLIVIMNQKD